MSQNVHPDKRSILTQNSASTARKIKLRWLFLIPLLSIFFVLGVYAMSPNPSAKKLAIKMVVNEITLPLPVALINHNETFWQMDQVRSDDTLNKLLTRMAVRDDDAFKFLMLSPDTRAINTQLIPGRTIQVKTNLEGKLLHLEYELPEDSVLVADLSPSGYQVTQQKLDLQTHPVYKSATIISSLFGATDDADIPDQIALQIADIFSSEIDFNEDLHPNDHFSVVYDEYYNNGELRKTGEVQAVEFVTGGKTYRAIRYANPEGKVAYYTPEGKSLHKSFLRSPLEFTRVSSSFNPGRFHPVLHRFRAHKGVDLAARMGTRVKASGDGVVKFMGRKGGYGNVIILNHPNHISTLYGHLSGFAKGLHTGGKVAQGDIIGYVGMTGLATGPHLHYEFLLNGVHHDPMTVALPTSIPINPKYKQDFETVSKALMAKIEMINHTLMLASK